jgi:hypothetical protein
VFSLIHKFNQDLTEPYSELDDIIVISDEAHRAEAGRFARNMRMVLPKASLSAEVDKSAWASLYSTKSSRFDPPSTGRIAIKVINHYGDEVLKVYEISEELRENPEKGT